MKKMGEATINAQRVEQASTQKRETKSWLEVARDAGVAEDAIAKLFSVAAKPARTVA